MSKITVAVGADVVPTSGSRAAFTKDTPQLLQSELAGLWHAADFRVFNLETPLADADTPIEKCGMALRAPTDCIAGICALAPSCVSLANNHIFDHGAAGLHATLETLARAGIPYFGAGQNAAEADGAHILQKDGVRIGVYAVCEHEFSCAGANTPGANAFDALEIADRIRALKQACDHLIVLYHGGREYDPYPSPELAKRCRKMAECGADAVLCQHSHCIGSYEVYHGATIVYGQGNFLFDLDDEPCFDRGLIVLLTFDAGRTEAAFVPVVRRSHGASKAGADEARAILDGFLGRSEELKQPGFIESRYAEYAASQRERMLKVFLSGNRLLRAVNVLYGRKPTRVYSRATQLAIKNSLQCEALNELLIKGL